MLRALLRPATLAALSLTTILSGCGDFARLREDEKVTKVNLGSDQRGRVGSLGTQNGGVSIWGVSADKSFALSLANEDALASKTLKNGTWTFYAIGWTGSGSGVTGPLAGAQKCGKVTKELKGTDTDVPIALSTAACADPFFSAASAVKPLRIVSCNDLAGVAGPAATCTGIAIGDLRSYKIALIDHDNGDFSGTSNPPLKTGCISTTGGDITSSFLIPDGQAPSSPVAVSIEAFPTTACTGASTATYVFGKGLRNGDYASQPHAYFPGSSNNVVFLQHGPVPAPVLSSISPTQGGWGGPIPITLNGNYFTTGMTVMVGAQLCSNVVVNSPTQATCLPPRSSFLNTVDINVTTGGGSITLPTSFTYVEDGFGSVPDTVAYDLTLNNNLLTTDTPPGLTRPFHSYASIKTIVGNNVTVWGSFTNIDFSTGDNVLWHVTATTPGGCEVSAPTLQTGSYGFAKVVSVNAGAKEIALDSTILAAPNGSALLNSSRTVGSPFCVIQLVRFTELNNLTINATSGPVSITPPYYEDGPATGGIIVLRVNGTLRFLGSNQSSISADGRGFAGGLAKKPGTSQLGNMNSAADSPLANGVAGGGGLYANKGGGGGAGFGNGGDGYGVTPGSSGGTGLPACLRNSGIPCGAFGGGGGGGDNSASTPATGAFGGGLVLVNARKIENSAGSTPVISANGNPATGEQCGGGGGGSAYLQYAQLIGFLNADAKGSDGNTNGKSGGGGGGGRVFVQNCAVTSNATINVAGGTSLGTYPGVTGFAGLSTPTPVPPGTSFCPAP